MKNLELTQMEEVQGGNKVANGILYGCLAVGVASSIGLAFVTFGTSLFWGASLTAGFCSGAAVGAAAYNAK